MSSQILICDDNDDDVFLLLHSLTSVGLSVNLTRGRDGEEALDCLQSGQKFDLVILDHRLPRRSGKEVIDTLHQLGGFPCCPVVMLTSGLEKEEQRVLIAKGVHTVLEKPFSLEGYLELGKCLAKLSL